MSYLMTLLKNRVSAYQFAPGELSDAEMQKLLAAATLAPSAYHLQNCYFTVVRSEAAKQKLQAAAYGQEKISQAAAVFVISGHLLAYQQLGNKLVPVVAAGQLPAVTAQAWQTAATQAFHQQPQAQRDEAIRSASLAAMPLMLAAQEAGWASCPMSGFDANAVRTVCGLPSHFLPVLLLAVGKSGIPEQPQKIRLPVAYAVM